MELVQRHLAAAQQTATLCFGRVLELLRAADAQTINNLGFLMSTMDKYVKRAVPGFFNGPVMRY